MYAEPGLNRQADIFKVEYDNEGNLRNIRIKSLIDNKTEEKNRYYE